VTLALRPATPSDDEFLFALFVSSRVIDLAFLPEPQLTALMRMQFRGQYQTYTQHYPASEHNIICVDGSDAGRLWVSETEEAIRILDIALLPAYRHRGIGKQIYAGLVERAKVAGAPLRATVSTANPGSFRFHERLGFQRSGSDGMYISMMRFNTL
jgi:GNAT superfamily N-acetyltransferase